jgi:hypothetical protein
MSLELLDSYEFVSRDAYRAVLDDFGDADGNQMCLMHIAFDLSKFSKSALSQMLDDWKLFRSVTDAPLYGIEPEPDNDKWERFVSLLGFQNTNQRVLYRDGLSRRLFVSLPDRISNNEHKLDAEDRPD